MNQLIIQIHFERLLTVGLFALQKAPRSGLDPLRKCIYPDF
jgi:hypothetical protein